MTGKTPSQVSRWFSEELAGLFPGWMKAMFFGVPMASKLKFSKNIKDIVKKRGYFIAPTQLLNSEIPSLKPMRKRVVDATVPSAFFLKRTVEAPASARKKLIAIVELDMVRRTPFRPDTVYTLNGRPKKLGNSIFIDQWIAKRVDIEDLRARFDALGLRIRRIYVDDVTAQGPIADLSGMISPNTNRWRGLNALLFLGAIILAGMVWLFPAWLASVEQQNLAGTITRYRTQALVLRKGLDLLHSREQERSAFLDIVYKQPKLTQTLRDLTIALPDDVWISDLNFSPNHVVVSGEAKQSAAQLVLDISSGTKFQNPRLNGVVSRAANGAERFELTLDLGGAK